MRRLIFAVVMAVFLGILLWFVAQNMNETTLGYDVVFRFSIGPWFMRYSPPVPVGFVLIVSFCLGMIAIAFLEALPSFYKTLELRAKNKRIRQLERELKLVREMMESEKGREEAPLNPAPPSVTDAMP
ncbi:MAG: LapA family protein [Deltaproteobacteria bacterium]|nr:LapA family protein [Deltaproteobacteria bacterium]